MRYLMRALALVLSMAPPICANAQPIFVMYGTADAGAAYVKTDSLLADGTRTRGMFRVDSGVQSPTRLGFAGRDDLGGGLVAFFSMESFIFIDDGTGASAGGGIDFTRRSAVGLRGPFGQISFGRDYTPAAIASYPNDIADYSFFGGSLAFQILGYQSSRFSNGIFYSTPTWQGLQWRVALGNATGNGTEYATSPKGRDRNVEMAVVYAAAPWKASAYYRLGNSNTLTAGGGLIKIRQYGAGGGYDFGRVRIVGAYAAHDPDDVGTFTDRVQMFSLGLGVRVGAGELMGQVFQARFSDVGSGTPKATFAMLAYTYPLSKRTNLYANYGHGRNVNGANFPVVSGSSPYGLGPIPEVNSKPTAIAVGIRHRF